MYTPAQAFSLLVRPDFFLVHITSHLPANNESLQSHLTFFSCANPSSSQKDFHNSNASNTTHKNTTHKMASVGRQQVPRTNGMTNGQTNGVQSNGITRPVPQRRQVRRPSLPNNQPVRKPQAPKAHSSSGEMQSNGVTSAYAIMAGRIANRVAEMAESITFVERSVDQIHFRSSVVTLN